MSIQIEQLVISWLEQDRNETTRNEIKELSKANDRQELEKRLSKRIEFGTAGLRGKMEAGFSRMNDLTVLQASQGLACYVKNTIPNSEGKGIVIGHDHRHNSSRFAELTALAFVGKGFKVYKLGMCHTPLVPFGVDELQASCGVMITASHNPAQDNGYKVYWQNGCQIIPPHDIGIAKSIEEHSQPWSWDVSLLENNELVINLESQLVSKYFSKINKVLGLAKVRSSSMTSSQIDGNIDGNVNSFKDSLQFVYTPMHGVGLPYLQEAASQLGLTTNSVVTVNEQAQPDADFPTVKFPNPEEKGALDLAIQLADSKGISIVLANDPDADRFAVAVKDDKIGEWKQLTGNQIGAIFANYWYDRWNNSKHHNSTKKLCMLNSTVSSQLMSSLADKYNFHYEDTLTGFKWIGNRSITLEYQGYDIPFAYEEALGYMFPTVHDKDGISAAYVFIQILLLLNSKSISLLDQLESIYKGVGYFEEHNSYYIVNDPAQTAEIFEYIRKYGITSDNQHYPETIGRFKVQSWRDLTIGYDSTTPNNIPVLPVSESSQMITVILQNDSSNEETIRFTARGSGTEPKLKVYIEAKSTSKSSAKKLADEVWNVLQTEWFRPSITGLIPV